MDEAGDVSLKHKYELAALKLLQINYRQRLVQVPTASAAAEGEEGEGRESELARDRKRADIFYHYVNRAFADRRGYLIMSLSRVTTWPT